MFLVDTSVWIDYLRQGNDLLSEKLKNEQVVMHAMVLGELAVGSFNRRQLLLKQWRSLPYIPTAADAQALTLLEEHKLMGKGIGWIDLHLLTAVSLAHNVKIWTNDKRLRAIATDLNLAVSEI